MTQQTPETPPVDVAAVLASPEFVVLVDAAVQAALAARDAEDQAKIDAANAEAEAAAAAAATKATQKRKADEAERARWEGHTHSWGAAGKAGTRTCGDCKLELPAELIDDAAAAKPPAAAGKRA